MKLFRASIFLLGMIGLFPVGGNSAANETTCEPTTNPFADPATTAWKSVSDTYSPNVDIIRVCTFSGHVERGEKYTQEIKEGLVFYLRPSKENDGWDIGISDTPYDPYGLSDIVTPPFRGINPTSIKGFHFRNDTNTAENDGSVNAPQEIRGFNFLLSRSDLDNVSSAHYCTFRNECENGLTPDEADKIIAASPKSRGILTITNFELGNLVPNDSAWFEFMDFEVRIYLPEE
jgi:hypothetical protein